MKEMELYSVNLDAVIQLLNDVLTKNNKNPEEKV
jgi:hypothetical protein